MANTRFKAENGLIVVNGNSQFDTTTQFNANVTVAADQWYIGGDLYVTGTQVFVGGSSAVSDILASVSGLKIGNTTYQFDGYFANVYVYGTALNPVGNTTQLGNSTNRWVISGNSLNISTTSTFTGAANALSTFGITGAANALSTLGVREATTLANTLAVTGSATFANTVAVTGNTTLTNLSISGTANALSTFGITGAANALSTLGVRGATTLANTLAVTGTTTLSNTLAVTGTTTLTGNATLNGTLQTISGNAAFNSTTLFIDALNNRVGIGTNAPDSTLKIQGSFTANGPASFINTTSFANTTAHTGSATFANTVQVTGTASFNDVTVAGNLTVSGTTTYINTQNLNIGDNIITLNADLPVSSAPTENTGIEINRGSSANSRLQWNETTDTWQASFGSVSTFYNILTEGTTNTTFDSGTLFIDALNNRVGVNTATPAYTLDAVVGSTGIANFSDAAATKRLWLAGNSSGSYVFNADNGPLRFGTANTSRVLIDAGGNVAIACTSTGTSTLTLGGTNGLLVTGAGNVQTTLGVGGLLTGSAGLVVTGTTNTSAQFNVGGGVATTNGATITNTSISLGNSSVNTQISPSLIQLWGGNTTSNSAVILGSQVSNVASLELGGTSSAFIDFKVPNEDDFDTRLLSNASGFHIIAGSSTSANVLNITSANVNIDAGTLFVDAGNGRVGINNTAPGVALRVTGAADISSTANVQGAGNVGGALGVGGLITGSAGLNVTGIANVTISVNSALLTVGTNFIANTTGAYHTGTMNAASHTVGSNFIANTTAIVGTGFANVTTSVNSSLLTVGTNFIANTTGAYHTGTMNAASHTVGALFTANSTLVNAAAINVTGQVNTSTLFVTTSANVGTALIVSATALTVAPNTNIGGGDLFVDTVNGRVGINNTAPGVALRVTGDADISSTANVQGNANVGGTLGVTGVVTLSANLAVDATTLFVDAVNNRVGIRDSSPVNALTVNGITDTTGSIYIAKTAADNGVTAGIELQSLGTGYFTRAGTTAIFNRLVDDGTIIAFAQAGTVEGSIQISGSIASISSFCGAHWSQLSDNSRPNILRGTVVETIDEMCQWENEANDQLTKFKISDTIASKSVYGVFQTWDNTDDVNNDANIASLGAYIIRVAAGVTVSKGDLLESAGNGCAKVQSDDIIRSSTIGKVTNGTHIIETYEDGSYLVPCVLYCG